MMFRFKHLTLILFLLIACFSSNWAQQKTNSLTLEETIAYALAHNNGIKNAQINLADADLQIKQNKASGLPQVNGSVDLQRFLVIPKSILPDFISPAVYGVLAGEGVKNGKNETITVPQGDPQYFAVQFGQKNSWSAGVSASQLLFSGSYIVALKASKYYKEFVTKQLEAKKVEVRNAVVNAYLPPLLLSEILNTLDKNIQNLEKVIKTLAETKKAGFVEQLDIDRTELSLANLRTQREATLKQRELALTGLKFAINYPYEQPLEVKDNIEKLLTEATAQELTEAINYSNRAEYKVAESGIEMNNLNVELNKAAYLPTVAAYASGQYTLTGNKIFKNPTLFPTVVVGVKATVPIWDSYEKKSKIERAQLAVETANNQKKDLERAIDVQVRSARINYENATTQVKSQKQNLDLAEKIYKTTQIKYKEGVGSNIETIQAEQALYQAQFNYTQAIYNVLVAKTDLNKALGK